MFMRRNFRLGVVALTALVACVPISAKAQTLFDNFQSDGAFNKFAGYVVSGYYGVQPDTDVGFGFAALATARLSLITVGLAHFAGSDAADLFLYEGNGSGMPGNLLETFTINDLPQAFRISTTPVTVASTVHPLLVQGQQYFLVASTSGASEAVFNFAYNDTGTVVYREDDGPFVVSDQTTRPAARLVGTAVPGPSSLVLFGGGMATGWMALRRRRK
jgi:hypothetical protein